MILAVTGHRPHKLNFEFDMKGPCSNYIVKELRRVIGEEKPEKIISGMALGVDMIFAGIGIQMGIPVIAAIPCEGQERVWKSHQQEIYRRILDHPLVESHVVSPGPYAAWKMQARNVWQTDRADKLVAVWDGSSGGTGNCVKYAVSKGKTIIRIDPSLWNKAELDKT